MSIRYMSAEAWADHGSFNIIMDECQKYIDDLIMFTPDSTVAVVAVQPSAQTGNFYDMKAYLVNQQINHRSVKTKYGLGFLILDNDFDLATLRLAFPI